MTGRLWSDNPALSRFLEKQMRNWELSHSQRPGGGLPSRGEVAQFLTIGNIVGAGGNDVAATLGEELGWPVFDRQILTAMAGDHELRARLYRTMDERDLGWFESIFRALMLEEFRKDDYFHRLVETVLVLARKGPAIFVGRAADLILPEGKGFRVKLIASLEYCAGSFASRNNTTPAEARREVERIEAERRAFIEHHFQIDAYEPTRFDLLINVERFTTRQAVDLILSAMRLRGILADSPHR